jgi:uncharacterized protein DUF1553/uncharacterized protein DUF1549
MKLGEHPGAQREGPGTTAHARMRMLLRGCLPLWLLTLPLPMEAAVTRLEISPPALKFYGKGARERVFVTAVLSTGRAEDVTARASFRSLGACVQAGAGGSVAAVRDGTSQVEIRYGGGRAILPVQVARSAGEQPVSFQYDVLPVMTRAGCSQGTCHGNAEGKGGLKLSLKGEDPGRDYEVIARHGGGRRLNHLEPGRSLLLLKATSAVPHGGGLRFATGSPEYRVLGRWIAEGARADAAGAPRLVRLEVSPRQRVLVEPARMQRLTVLGHFSDGSIRNLAQKAIYNCGDPMVGVDADGRVEGRGGGDAAVLVRYADRMENAFLTFVPVRKGFAWKTPPAYNWIDSINDRRLKLLRLQPSRPASDSEFIRRAYLDALGVLPTPEEVRTFLGEAAAERQEEVRKQGNEEMGKWGNGGNGKAAITSFPHFPISPMARAKLIDQLLKRPEFDDYWTLKWADILRLEERSLDPKGAAAYQQWIRASIVQSKPLDQFARELLTATGSTYASPPANYYRRTRTPADLGETTAQVFLGTRMLCAKCHNHPFERWSQDDYYSLAAIFARVERKGELTRRDQFDKHELSGEETIGLAKEGEVTHPRTGQPVAPRLPRSGRALDPSVEDRRVPFASWLTAPENPFFAKAMVNRIWYYLMGKGIVDPVDDLRDSNPPSNAELLEALARDFAAHRYDLRHVVRTIMNSRTYQAASEPNGTNAEDERFFSRAIAQRMPAEVLLDAISQVTEAPEKFANVPEGTRAVQLPAPAVRGRHPFLRLFGQPGRESVCECERTNETTLGQSFALISGGVLDGKLKRPDNRIGRLLTAGKTDAEIVSELYLAALSREPQRPEVEGTLKYVAGKPDRRAALEDVLWALVNSKEFLLRR